jgi:pimeloyl-CoA dehydrogenase
MDLELTPEQQAFCSSLRHACDDMLAPFSTVGAHDRAIQTRILLSALDVYGLLMPTELGGAGAGPVEAALVSEELGRWCANAEFLESIVMCGELIRKAATAEQRRRWLRPLGAGKITFGIALPACSSGNPGGEARFELRGGKYVLTARQLFVPELVTCDVFLVPACAVSGGSPLVFAVSAHQAGVMRKKFEALDGSSWLSLGLSEVLVDGADVLGSEGQAKLALALTFDLAQVVLCAESVGAAETLLTLCCDYLKARKQFGLTLSQNQVLRHTVADMRISIELMRSMAYLAAAATSLDISDPNRRVISRAREFVDSRARTLAAMAIQLHGATGLSEDCAIGKYLRRLLFIRNRMEAMSRFEYEPSTSAPNLLAKND